MSVNAINLKRAQIAQAVQILSNAFDKMPNLFFLSWRTWRLGS